MVCADPVFTSLLIVALGFQAEALKHYEQHAAHISVNDAGPVKCAAGLCAFHICVRSG